MLICLLHVLPHVPLPPFKKHVPDVERDHYLDWPSEGQSTHTYTQNKNVQEVNAASSHPMWPQRAFVAHSGKYAINGQADILLKSFADW